MSNSPLILNTKTIAKTRLFCVEEMCIRFSNGEERIYEKLHMNAYSTIMVVPFLNSNTILLIREYAAGSNRYELGFPTGQVEQNESLLEAANRELMEETGYASHQLEKIRAISLVPGHMNYKTHVIMAEKLYPSNLIGDEPEKIKIEPWAFSQIDQLLLRADFSDSRSIAALFLINSFLKKRNEHGS